MSAHWHNLVGMVGVTLILVSYLLLQTGRIQQYVFLIVAGTVVLVAGFIIF